MGQVITRLCKQEDDVEIIAGVTMLPNEFDNPYPTYDSFEQVSERADVVIDFSNPSILPSLLKYCIKNHSALVLATTGLSESDLDMVRQASEVIPIFKTANMSLGINVLLELVYNAASALGHSFDIEIIEKHHNEKKDAPSGTALMIADEINSCFANTKSYIYDRSAVLNKRDSNEIGIHSIRGGTIPGEHSVLFAGKDEIIEIKHTAQSRDIFGTGAIRAAQYIVTKLNGIYDMKTMLKELI